MVDAPPHLIGMHRAVVCSLQQFFVQIFWSFQL
jgi:hypothetical protein